MSQLSRALVSSLASEHAVDSLINTVEQRDAQARIKRVNARETRQALHGLKRYALLSNTIAPGVDVMRYLGVSSIGKVIDYRMGKD